MAMSDGDRGLTRGWHLADVPEVIRGMNMISRCLPLILLAGFLAQPSPTHAQQGTPAGPQWVTCTDQAAPPPGTRTVSGRLPPIPETTFRVAAALGVLSEVWEDESDSGCVLFLMRWTREGELEPVRILESGVDEATAARIQDALLEYRVLRAPSPGHLRVRVQQGSNGELPELAVGFAWEELPSLANADEVEDLVAAVQVGTAPRRDIILRAVVSEEGLIEEIEVVRPSGDSFVDQQFLWVSEFFRFHPARVEGSPIPGTVQLPFVVLGDRGALGG